MKILFTTDRRDGPSTMWYEAQLAGLGSIPGVEIDLYNRDYVEYDVILFMGYDPRVGEAKSANPTALVGVIDARPAARKDIEGADFVVANGIEMQDWYAGMTSRVFMYPPYPLSPPRRQRNRVTAAPLVLGYHGNTVHITGMYPRITRAVERLAEDCPVEIWALYDVGKWGEWRLGAPKGANIRIRHMQWSRDGLQELLEGVDVGIVPNFIPLVRRRWGDSKSVSRRTFNDDDTDYLLRYKATSNAGRIFVFAQQGIPVVSDMFPSALQLIEHGVDGYLCYSSAGWYRALDSLASDPERVGAVGDALRRKYEERWSPPVLNARLVEFLSSLTVNEPQKRFDDCGYADRPGGWSYFRDVKMLELNVHLYSRVARFVKRKLRRW